MTIPDSHRSFYGGRREKSWCYQSGVNRLAHRHPLRAFGVSCCDQCKGPLQTLSTEPLLSVSCLPFPSAECKEPPCHRNSSPWPSCRAPLTMMVEEPGLLLPFCGAHLSIEAGVFHLGNHSSKSHFRPLYIATYTLHLFC